MATTIEISGADLTPAQLIAFIKQIDHKQQQQQLEPQQTTLFVHSVVFNESVATAFLQLLRRRNNDDNRHRNQPWRKIIFHGCNMTVSHALDASTATPFLPSSSCTSLGDCLLIAAMHNSTSLALSNLRLNHHTTNLVQQFSCFTFLMELTCTRHLTSLFLLGQNIFQNISLAQALYDGLSTNHSLICLEILEGDIFDNASTNNYQITPVNPQAIQIVSRALAESNVLQTLRLYIIFTDPTNAQPQPIRSPESVLSSSPSLHLFTDTYWQQLLLPLRHHKTLQSLDVYGNETFGDFLQPISTLLTSQLSSLACLKIGGFVRTYLDYFIQSLAANDTIQELLMFTKSFSDSELYNLSIALKHNKTLQRLESIATFEEFLDVWTERNTNTPPNDHFSNKKEFSSKGMESIVAAMHHNVTLQRIILPNCLRVGFHQYQQLLDFYTNLNKAGRYLIATSNVNTVPPSLWPLVLERITASSSATAKNAKDGKSAKITTSFMDHIFNDTILPQYYCNEGGIIQKRQLQATASVLYWFLRQGPVLFDHSLHGVNQFSTKTNAHKTNDGSGCIVS